jgi:hypothetical protein
MDLDKQVLSLMHQELLLGSKSELFQVPDQHQILNAGLEFLA